MICILKRIKKKGSERLWSLKSVRLSVDGGVKRESRSDVKFYFSSASSYRKSIRLSPSFSSFLRCGFSSKNSLASCSSIFPNATTQIRKGIMNCNEMIIIGKGPSRFAV